MGWFNKNTIRNVFIFKIVNFSYRGRRFPDVDIVYITNKKKTNKLVVGNTI